MVKQWFDSLNLQSQLNSLMGSKSKVVGRILGPVSFMVIMFINFDGLSSEGQAMLASVCWIAIWWVSEAIPIAATSLLPIVLFPLLGVLDIKTTSTTYYSPMIMLFLGGFIIALAIEKWNLHQRIALNLIKIIGTREDKIILGFMVATGFLSMWISNTATALMMLPIGLAITKKIRELDNEDASNENNSFQKALMLSIAYSSSIGGMATLIGTPTNAIFSALSIQLLNQEVSFAQWMSFGFPISCILLLIGWWYLTKVIFRSKLSKAEWAMKEINQQIYKLGVMSKAERLVAITFSLIALCWILRSFLLDGLLPGINDTTIAMFGALFLFVLPGNNRGEVLMDWETAQKLPWGILLLFGGGLTIASGFKSSGLAIWMVDQLSSLNQLHFALLLFLIIILVNFFTEITSNVATAAMLLPVLVALSETTGVHPFSLMVGTCVAASCAFMLPVATPANAIAYSSGFLSMEDMVRVGFLMNLISSIILFLCVYFLLPLIWGI